MKVRIVVADQAEVDFYDMQHAEEVPLFAGGIGDPVAHLHDRDIDSDRPGRVFDRAARPAGRRGATAHHATGSERTPRKREAELFARRIAKVLEGAHRDGEFERLVLMAPPGFLGTLRQALPPSLHSVVAAQISKDLVHAPAERVRSYLPPEVFVRPVQPA
jgi:protein required for attachment to host cells